MPFCGMKYNDISCCLSSKGRRMLGHNRFDQDCMGLVYSFHLGTSANHQRIDRLFAPFSTPISIGVFVVIKMNIESLAEFSGRIGEIFP